MEKAIEKYVELVIKKGINLQKGTDISDKLSSRNICSLLENLQLKPMK